MKKTTKLGLIKKITRLLPVIIMVAASYSINVLFTVYYKSNRYTSEKFHAFRYGIDNSIPFLTGSDNTSILLENPDRGFRMESYLTLGTNISYPYRLITPADEEAVPMLDGANASLQLQLQTYEQDKPKIIQQYIYLTLYRNRTIIPQKALDQLTTYFEYIRNLKIKMLLRFAYENENNVADPAQDTILAHVAELKIWFQNNSQLVADTVYCLQLGFLGWWGEGHSYKIYYDVPTIIAAVCEMVPSWMYVNVRTLGYYYQTPEQYRSRVGIHDDFLEGKYNAGTSFPENLLLHPYYRDLYQRTINDGELPWGSCQCPPNIDGTATTKYIYDYSLSTLSIVHNYIESGLNYTYNMYQWKTEYLDANAFENYGWNYNPNLLNGNGEISIFEYLKYHLGYQLVLSNLTTNHGKLGFMISNYGFVAPFNMDRLVLQVECINGSMQNVSLTYTPHGLYTYHQLVYSVALNFTNVESVGVKLFNSKNSDYVRFGNNIESDDGYYKLV
jgi:hypothetical protein